MRMINNLNIISSSLCSLGAHLGHLQVDAYQSLSYYILGNRSFFIIIDLDKSVYMLKSAIVFFEQMILHYGHAVFCHSSIVHFSLSLKNYLSRIITARNQSFSYWRWVPGCITNYRYVFLRLVELLFRDVLKHTDRGTLNMMLTKSFHSSFVTYYKRLWFWFLSETNIPVSKYKYCNFKSLKSKFNLFFMRSKKVLLNKYLASLYNRSVSTYECVRHGYDTGSIRAVINRSWNRRARWQKYAYHYYGYGGPASIHKNRYRHKSRPRPRSRYSNGKYATSSVRALPSFVSMLFRACYAIKIKECQIRVDFPDVCFDDEVLFRFLFTRLHTFWRAIIFFKCFRKTANLPDCLVMCNPDNSVSEFYDFIGVRLPIICLADTTTDITKITYPIPSNDDSIILFLFYFYILLNACVSASNSRALCEFETV